jgi:hypothetical protein
VQSRALGDEAEATMAREFTTGKAQAVTPEDFNERVKRLLANKPEFLKPEPKARTPKTSRPPQKT